MNSCPFPAPVALAIGALASPSLAMDPFADTVISYTPGTNATPGFTNASTALGSPERVTGELAGFPGAVTPFNSPFGTDELVSIGEGGSLTLRFDQPVTDDALNPFGIDLLIFGNTFLGLSDFSDPPNAVATNAFTEGGLVEVSTDGVTFIPVPGVQADGVFPTLGYADLTDPFAPAPGAIETDFAKPVDPSFNPIGRTQAEISAGYDGAGGGVGIDLATIGLGAISYVRISNPLGSGLTPEIDAISDVRAIPTPATLATLALACLGGRRRRFRTTERPNSAPHG